MVQDITFTSTTVGPIKINIPINDDLLCEGEEIFQVSLRAPGEPDVNLDPATGVVTIIDDDSKSCVVRILSNDIHLVYTCRCTRKSFLLKFGNILLRY